MKLIRLGARSSVVKPIQNFLIGDGYKPGAADGIYGKKTLNAVKAYQRDMGLYPDGIIGNATLRSMLSHGLALMPEVGEVPPKPDFRPLVSNKARNEIFGEFRYTPRPTNNNPEGIRILGGWESDNIVSVDLPELSKATGGEYTRMRVHKLVEGQLRELWREWDKAGLIHLIKSYEGAFYPRYVRGSRKTLSNHSWGTAFDINYWWNKLGATPAYLGEEGSVRELVPIANKLGWYWGGHFNRGDGMHFEIAKVL